jgi:hypothetical protein
MRTRSDDGTGAVIETDRSHHIEVDRWAVSPQNVVSDFGHSDRRSLWEAHTYRERESRERSDKNRRFGQGRAAAQTPKLRLGRLRPVGYR